MDSNDRNPNRLRALERWREAELESAQARYVERSRAAADKQDAHNRVQSEMRDTQSFLREQLHANEPLSPESLRRVTQFTALKAEELAAARQALDESRASCDAARAEVLRGFEQLSAVRRFNERRERAAAQDETRADQKRLDEHALSRLSATTDGIRTNQE